MDFSCGDLPSAQRRYEACFSIAQLLAAQDQANAEWQRALWVGYNKLGEVQQAQDNLTGAHQHYLAGLAIAERLVAHDPANAGRQNDLSISYEMLGDVQRGTGRPARRAAVL